MIRTEIDSLPAELDAIRRRIVQLEIEKEALTREKDEGSKKKLEALEKEYSELKAKNDEMTAKFDREKGAILKLKELKGKLDEARGNLEAAQRQYDYNKAAEIQYGEIPSLEAAINQMEVEVKENYEGALLKEEVTEEEVSQVLSKWTGIPVSNLLEGEREKLLRLESEMEKRVIGQEEAIKSVTSSILRARAGLKDINRPIGSFIFLGPTGVGKTELAKTLARNLFDSEENIIRIDMSEYMEKHSVSRLVGAPPGYVGYEEGGQLTEAVRRHPYSIVLLDEVEKAHPDVFNILLQILDDGRITDSKGVTVDFKNTIIIMTSNLGSEYAFEKDEETRRKHYEDAVHAFFKPEFVNRIDEIIVFNALGVEVQKKIADKFLGLLADRLKEKDITLEVTEKAKERIIKLGVDPQFGARPMRRHIQRAIETEIAKVILSTDNIANKTIVVDANDDRYLFSVQ